MKICIACSPGGHLIESLQLLPILRKHEVFFYTVDEYHVRKTLKKYRKYFGPRLLRNPLQIFDYIKNIFKSISVLLKEKPYVIISFGAGETIPISVFGKLFGRKLIYIECSAQVYTPSISGKILYPFADLFFVQWRYLLKKYGDDAIYGGLLI